MDMRISLVIPLKDEEKSIGALIDSISSQTRRPDEVIFVDAGSVDATRPRIEKLAVRIFDASVITAGAVYPGIARNIGVEKAKYELIAFTDGGMTVDKDWLKNLSAVMEKDEDIEVVYGHYMPNTDTFFRECLALTMMQPLQMIDGRYMRLRSIASSLMKKSVWRAVGGFPDLRAGEDRVFMEKIDSIGFRTGCSPDAVMIWDIPKDLGGVFRRFSSYSYHNALAGRISGWHIPVLRMYALAAVISMLGLAISPVFFFFFAAAFAIRVAGKIYGGRNDPYFRARNIPGYLVTVGFLIIFIDLAMFAGWAESASRRARSAARRSGAQ